ncbi:Abi family protein [Thiocapsa rosea]|uniref:Abortive infection bacteriophage resistance protein n=1 Tax=Thiocapsa rosea TaxID=69360 RepID=A0A495UKV4_9GAMM|nr:Abi family protein [Thiocapsa rosea]RKT37851.1 abortive infection bacteriophage resistance protein [Thiocapsa rosea]
MKPYAKPPLPPKALLRTLASRGLMIEDPSAALHALKRVGYYRLSGYWLPFKQPDDSFESGLTFATVIGLYELDRQFRMLVLDAIERVEVALRSAIADRFANRYGVFGHLDRHNFRPSFDPRRRVSHDDWLASLTRAGERSKELFIAHHSQTYHGFPALPVWKMAEVITLGDLSMWFAALRDRDRAPIAALYGVDGVVLTSWLHTLSHVRNICAHHSRLWDRGLSIVPKVPNRDPRWLPPGVPHRNRAWIALLILRQMLCPHHQGIDWQAAIEELLTPIAGAPRWRNRMGLPEDWMEHPLWNLT